MVRVLESTAIDAYRLAQEPPLAWKAVCGMCVRVRESSRVTTGCALTPAGMNMRVRVCVLFSLRARPREEQH